MNQFFVVENTLFLRTVTCRTFLSVSRASWSGVLTEVIKPGSLHCRREPPKLFQYCGADSAVKLSPRVSGLLLFPQEITLSEEDDMSNTANDNKISRSY